MRFWSRVQRWLKRRPLSLGQQGEKAAARYLRRRGYRIVRRGSRDRIGELDIVAVKDRTVVFVEVKTRRTHVTGHPAESVDDRKQQQLARAAISFLKHHDLLEQPARFDVVAITWPAGVRRPSIEHYENAFEPPSRDPSMFG